MEVFKIVLKEFTDMTTSGFICLSKKKKNQVKSNIFGAAAYHGNIDLLKFIQNKSKVLDINYKAWEVSDKHATKLIKEWSGFTPLMLAISGTSFKCLDCIKFLLTQNANFGLKDHDQNTVLHLCAIFGNNKALEWITKNVKVDVFARNAKGETVMSIAKEKNNEEAIKTLTPILENDESKTAIESLLNEMEQEK